MYVYQPTWRILFLFLYVWAVLFFLFFLFFSLYVFSNSLLKLRTEVTTACEVVACGKVMYVGHRSGAALLGAWKVELCRKGQKGSGICVRLWSRAAETLD